MASVSIMLQNRISENPGFPIFEHSATAVITDMGGDLKAVTGLCGPCDKILFFPGFVLIRIILVISTFSQVNPAFFFSLCLISLSLVIPS